MFITDASRITEGDIINKDGNKLVIDLVRGSMIRYRRLKQVAGAVVAGGMTSTKLLQVMIDNQEVTVERP